MITDETGRPVPHTWSRFGRPMPLADTSPGRPARRTAGPEFPGAAASFTDEHGRYRFVTIRPARIPGANHHNAWRPNHIHFSYFGPAFATRLVTQMYFPGDPLLAFDPIFHAVPDDTRASG